MKALKLPTSWKEVNLGKFQELVAFQEQNKGKTGIDSIIGQLAILSDEDPEDIKNINLSEFDKIKNDIAFSYQTPSEKFEEIIELDGIRYGMIPVINKITLGEWVDIEERIKDGAESIHKNFHYIISILYRPIVNEKSKINGKYDIEEYDSEKMEERAMLFHSKLSIEAVYGSALFFYHFAELYSNNTLGSLENKKMDQILEKLLENRKKIEKEDSNWRKLKRKLTKIGYGMVSFIGCLKEIPSRWKKQQNYRSSTV